MQRHIIIPNFVLLFTTVLLLLLLPYHVSLVESAPENENDRTTTTTTSDDSSSVPLVLPNFIIFFADNLGYNDISYFQTKESTTTTTKTKSSSTESTTTIKTKYIDEFIGEQGMKLNHWNSVGHLCSPSRASLLTGLYPIRTGVYPNVFHPDSKYGLFHNNNQLDEMNDTSTSTNHNSSNRKTTTAPLPNTTTIARYLKETYGYKTSIIGKWHLGHSRPEYLPTSQYHGFDEWIGIPYHMSGGSIHKEHVCVKDVHKTMWLPLYNNTTIVEQPVQIQHLARTYIQSAIRFIQESISEKRPFFLYLSFSHVHQLCAAQVPTIPHRTCQWINSTTLFGGMNQNITYKDAVQEMDEIIGMILQKTIDHNDTIKNNTFILFTSDNGPWIAEQHRCAGTKGPFQGKWLSTNVPQNCTACPLDYEHNPTIEQPRRCTLMNYENKTNSDDNTNTSLKNTIPPPFLHHSSSELSSDQDPIRRTTSSGNNNSDDDDDISISSLDGIHCGEDSGLGSCWEANLRVPALVRWPGKVPRNSTSDAVVSTLDVLPTFIAIIEQQKQQQYQEHSNMNSFTSQRRQEQQQNSHKTGTNDNNRAIKTHHYQLDGVDISDVLFGTPRGVDVDIDNNVIDNNNHSHERVLFFWRDGFLGGPLPSPYGRYDIVAIKIGYYKLWYYTKSAHYNADDHVHHDPPLIFNTYDDPAEEYALPITNNTKLEELIQYAKRVIQQHRDSIQWTPPLTLAKDPQYIPCVNPETNCRTTPGEKMEEEVEISNFVTS